MEGAVADYLEIDFLGVETAKSGDAIAVRYSVDGVQGVHIVDGGYLDTGDQLVEHIKKYYGTTRVDNVVLTHPDQDHANGLRVVLEKCDVGCLWINRPWIYAEELIHRFENYESVDALRRKLRSIYDASATLEDLANEKGIPIRSPLQGESIGPFSVLAPSRERYLNLIVESERTPEAATESIVAEAARSIFQIAKAAAKLIASAWGHEIFPPGGTSSENEMSVVQIAVVNDLKFVLTGDTGRDGLNEAADYVTQNGVLLPGVKNFQVPHHGGRHNVDTEVLDRWLGPRLAMRPEKGTWNAICSSAKADENHPRKSVVRAMQHRGAHFSATEGRNLRVATGIEREGWTSVDPAPYPEDQEE